MPPANQKPRFLVTAGNTREMIDRVRDWGNIFTGNTGFAIAKALRPLGDVELITSNKSHLEQARALGMTTRSFTDHASLLALLAERVTTTAFDAVFMTAAVADYSPAGSFAVSQRTVLPDGSEQWTVRDVQAAKVKSSHPAIAVLGMPTKKIIDCFRREWGYKNLLVKFKLEVGITKEELISVGQASRIASGADYLIANTLEMVEGDRAGAYLISEAGEEWVARGDLASRCAGLAWKSE
ncbi:MAG: hypothetical protein H7144_11250 [Burkholderiales bacterium]|nr:hypothetical protein [Phycisphaerae bacterium]